MNAHRVTRRLRTVLMLARARCWTFMHPGIQVGKGARIGRGCRLFLDPGARLLLGAGAEIDDQTTIAVYGDAQILIGPGGFIGHHSTLAARSSIEIGKGTYLAELVSIRDHDHLVGVPPASGEMSVESVVIGEDVWIGAKTTVVRGARIGDGVVVGANAVVRAELPARSLCAGIPARVVRMLDPAAGSEHADSS